MYVASLHFVFTLFGVSWRDNFFPTLRFLDHLHLSKLITITFSCTASMYM